MRGLEIWPSSKRLGYLAGLVEREGYEATRAGRVFRSGGFRRRVVRLAACLFLLASAAPAQRPARLFGPEVYVPGWELTVVRGLLYVRAEHGWTLPDGRVANCIGLKKIDCKVSSGRCLGSIEGDKLFLVQFDEPGRQTASFLYREGRCRGWEVKIEVVVKEGS